ncbi:hypothetical protein GOP47_0008665 [Adiantum capillus-veneris]|uniref:VQ domain-containing protein n=1 Tax=Adiantum capillus-veneris TaxID=13818 RepID=A0A9D4ZKY1_ADICA|nr:hypothetical protein GOP47_0008665 [Adiantum capillus-veneris]
MGKRKLSAASSTASYCELNIADSCSLPGKNPLQLQETILSSAEAAGRAGSNSTSTTHTKVRRRKSRAKPKVPIKELSADRFTFREMVHQHTGLLHAPSRFPSPATTNPTHENEASTSSAYFNSSHSYDFPSAVNSLMNSPSCNSGSTRSPHPSLISFATSGAQLVDAAYEPQLINDYPTKSPSYTDLELMITNSNFIKLACVLLQQITSRLSSNCC